MTRFRLSPAAYRRVAYVALAGLSLIVLTGAAVRLTGSGLGCPDWPQCHGKAIAPLETHAVIEYGNRVFSAFVGIAALAAGVLAWLRRPFRRDLAVIGALLPLGVVCQAVLGGFTVRYHLAPGFVMSHYILSMLILIAAVALVWRAREEDAPDSSDAGQRGQAALKSDGRAGLAATVLMALGTVAIFVGTAATAAGRHAGGEGTGDEISRLDFKGSQTLEWTVHAHGRISFLFGLATLTVFVLFRRRGWTVGDLRSLVVLLGLLAAQGVVGSMQWALELPAELVWVHVGLATASWLALLWFVAECGLFDSRRGSNNLKSGSPGRNNFV